MKHSDPDSAALHVLILNTVLGTDFVRGSWAGTPRDLPTTWVRVQVRPVIIRQQRQLQFSYFDGKTTESKNFPVEAARAPLEVLLSHGFSGIHLETSLEEIDIRQSKKGRRSLSRRPRLAPPPDAALAHNRVKKLPLPEGRADRFLEVLGISTASGQIRPRMRAKYTQVNQFLMQLEIAIADAGLSRRGRPLQILDCGCGLSYLTLAAHHYLNDILQIPATILGIDVNETLIRKSLERSHQVGTPGLSFRCGRIGAISQPADIVLALHACDTATDDALAQAIRSQAQLILSVPCCHHHLNRQLTSKRPELRPLLRHGIVKQRLADLLTDSFRALALRILGYRTEIIEFVSQEHTARNMMIRAIRGPSVGKAGFVAEYRQLRDFWNVTPYLEQALGSEFQARLQEHSTDAPQASENAAECHDSSVTSAESACPAE